MKNTEITINKIEDNSDKLCNACVAYYESDRATEEIKNRNYYEIAFGASGVHIKLCENCLNQLKEIL